MTDKTIENLVNDLRDEMVEAQEKMTRPQGIPESIWKTLNNEERLLIIRHEANHRFMQAMTKLSKSLQNPAIEPGEEPWNPVRGCYNK